MAVTVFDEGLLSPVTVDHDAPIADAAFRDALVNSERALVAAYTEIGVLPPGAAGEIDASLAAGSATIDPSRLASAAVGGGNPVIPLVGTLRQLVAPEHRDWIHRGATSQDVWDTAIMIVARGAVADVRRALTDAAASLRDTARAYRDLTAAGRTLTQHAVPTTTGLRFATWARGIDRAVSRLDALEFPAQLGGAAGTLASFVELTGSPGLAERLSAAFASAAGLAAPVAPWHVTRWPVTELADALVQAVDAVGVFAADVATLSRTEIAEVVQLAGGGSSAMPQKQNPTAAVLVRSAAMRAPQLGATLHLASALAVDERPDGAWHAEWPTLRELLRLALGASAHAADMASALGLDVDAVAANLALTRGLIVSERLGIVLRPLIGPDRFAALVAEVRAGGDLAALIGALPEAAGLDVAALVDPARYVGLAPGLVDRGRREATGAPSSAGEPQS